MAERERKPKEGLFDWFDRFSDDPNLLEQEEEAMARYVEETWRETERSLSRGPTISAGAGGPSAKVRRRSTPTWASEIEAPSCPDCGRDMTVVDGRYGYFWCCTGFFQKVKCKGTLPLRFGKAWDLTLGRFPVIPPDQFVTSDAFHFVAQWESLSEWAREAVEAVVDRVLAGRYEGLVYTSGVSALMDRLHKAGQRLRLAQWAYFFYQVEGDLPTKMDYWLNQLYEPDSLLAKVGHTEAQIEAVITSEWSLTSFADDGCQLLGRQMVIGPDGRIGKGIPYQEGARPDLLARLPDGRLVVVEIKRAGHKHKSGVRQVREYREEAKQVAGAAAGYIVAPGFPRGIKDDSIGLISYVIEAGRLYLVPWRKGAFI